jgi:hypothetical protein
LERPSGKLAFLYHGCVFLVVFLCLILLISVNYLLFLP